MVSAATLLFTYCRPKHTREVLNGLKHSTILPERLIIYQDGISEDTSEDKIKLWKEVNSIIHGVNWCECDVIEAKKNQGLSDSIVRGINRAFEYFDAIIVLEDDCVPQPTFIEFMLKSLEKYANAPNVFCINGSDEPVEVIPNGYDAYFMGRINSWGWATWKSKWRSFDRNYRIIKEIRSDNDLSKWLDVWGRDLEATLHMNVSGETDSWAAFWALSVMKRKGLCLSPYKSLVNNIGFDGTGRHCGCNKPISELDEAARKDFRLPDNAEVIKNYEVIFDNYYNWIDPLVREKYYTDVLIKWIEVIEKEGSIWKWSKKTRVNQVYVWGLGKVGKVTVKELGKYLRVNGIIDRNNSIIEYCSIRVIQPQDIPEGAGTIVVVPGYDMKNIYQLASSVGGIQLIPIHNFLEQVKDTWNEDKAQE
ncbi:Glycosyl transferase family 2 [Oribacterium sp. KHPX15]|nr:Glycosyl transferase family 2 [Oribacterium sp. KHPX15]